MRASQRVLGRFVALFLGMLAAACTTVPVAGNAVLEGTATYRERMALPEGAIFEASLEDASIADAPADVLGSIRIPAPSVPPISFRIPYDPKRVDAKRNYVVRARIVHEGRLLFTTDTAYLIPSGDAPRVEILLRRASGDAEETTSAVLTGVYTYAADAGWFIECGTGRRLPVAQEGDNAALESAYGEARYAPTAPLLATVEGRIEEREPMEGPVRPTLVVDRFIDIKPGSCEDASAASLENTYWKVMQIRGEPVIVGDRQREPHLILHPHDGRVTGHGGCNSMTGGYAVEDGGISFTQMASTMMACASGMEQERALHDALAAVANWRISGQQLQLLDREGTSVLELEARYLR
jgi:uncharacterized lipoprotein YbaY/heat shock protein HslJ